MKFVAILLLASSVEAVFYKAAQALAAGDLEGAKRGFEEVLKAQPNNLGALGNLGVVYSRMDRTADAIAVYRRALKLAPDEPGLWLNLGLAHLKNEDYAAAKPLFAKVEKSPLASDQSRELLATTQLYTGELDAAVSALERLPRSSSVLFLLGSAYLRSGRKADADAVFRELLTSAASPAQAQFLLGRAYGENALADEALAAFSKAAELDPQLPSIHLELGKIHISRRDNEAAERELRLALQAKPNDAEASYYLGALLVQLSRENEAVPLLERAREARPDGWGTYYYLGRAKLQQKETAAAIALLERAARLNAQESAVYYQLARAYQSAGRVEDARRARARTAELQKTHRTQEQQVFSNATSRP